MTFGYDTKVHHVLKALHSQNTVYDHALELLNCLSDVRVVDENSACLGNRNLGVVRDIEGDHRAICRFRSLEDNQYRKLASELTCLVTRLQSKNVKSIEIVTDRDSVTDQSVEIVPRTKIVLSTEQRKELFGLLYFDQIDARFMSLRKAQAKTCKWLLRTPQYRDWLNARPSPQANPSGFFWIKGKPGTGKSVMVKFLFSEAKRTINSTNTILISFFFNARGSELEKSTLGLYRSLLLQLLNAIPETKSVVDDLGTLGFQVVKRSGWHREIFKETFALALDQLQARRLCCYIDALDECPEDDVRDMVSFFEDLCSRESSSQFRICLSSRHYPEIGIRNALQMVLEKEQDHTEDIRLYINSQLKIGESLQADGIKAEILDKSSGIFLWVVLVIPLLNKEHDRGRIKALKRRLNEIPAGLHDLFIDILTRDCKNTNELYASFNWSCLRKCH
ncbi:hypothetical protein QQX98_007629 [Neonectria punicea]|uniref:Nephrocystin 3-like N-terminal domain-containing protein n=1 Tax=Neonectria punicea TaxID=979145 RepID=A0ABR1GXE7_9HYPO